MKGRDIILYNALLSADLRVSFHYGVDLRDDDGFGYDHRHSPKDDEEQRARKTVIRHHRTLIFPPSAKMLDGETEEDLYSIAMYSLAKTARNLRALEVNQVDEVWELDDVKLNPEDMKYRWTKPEDALREKRNKSSKSNKHVFRYVAYGNESTSATCYASICLVACMKGHGLPAVWRENGTKVAQE